MKESPLWSYAHDGISKYKYEFNGGFLRGNDYLVKVILRELYPIPSCVYLKPSVSCFKLQVSLIIKHNVISQFNSESFHMIYQTKLQYINVYKYHS